MYHANLASTLAGLTRCRLPVVWNVRHSVDRLEDEKTRTRGVIKAGALISRQANRIVYNSHLSARQHEQLGYRQSRTVVIPNGFDIGSFRPSTERRRHLRDRLGISDETFAVGLVARYHPMKDHRNFLDAARRIQAIHSNVVFLLAGRGVALETRELKEGIRTNAVGPSVRLL